MATVIELDETDLDLAGVYDRAAKGEHISIARGQGPRFKLVPEPDPPTRTGKRVPGRFAGQFNVPDEAFAPLTDEELKDWGY